MFGVDDAIALGLKIIDKVIPDPAAKAEAAQRMAELQQKGDLAFLEADVKLMSGQIEVNKMEAMHGGLFKGGWRPFVGWTCGFALAYKFILAPFLISVVQVVAHFTGSDLFPVEFLPDLEWQSLSVILLGMLGIGGLRTMEKRGGQK